MGWSGAVPDEVPEQRATAEVGGGADMRAALANACKFWREKSRGKTWSSAQSTETWLLAPGLYLHQRVG